jgi:nicotinate-nucleotide pyrophosphorylase (carboxylating)
MKELLTHPLVQQLIDIAFLEDIGEGDHTSLATIPPSQIGKSVIVAKEQGILAGVLLAAHIFKRVDTTLTVSILKQDGDIVSPQMPVMYIEGSTIAILTAERTVLNFIQRLSGIATLTSHYAKALQGLNTKIIDTRKTTPGMRILEKWAVKIGGGGNHRIGLYDMILIKDNHVDFAGGIAKAIMAAHAYQQKNSLTLPVEIETRTLEEVQEALDTGHINRIMLDNFSINLLHEAVALIGGKYETEASGGITLQTLRDYAQTGVDFISSGALTHSVKSLDFSMRAI